jgi:hypothetical protein
MAKAATKLNAQDRVILFCAATGIDDAAVGILAHAMHGLFAVWAGHTLAVGLNTRGTAGRRWCWAGRSQKACRKPLGVKEAALGHCR